MKSSEHDGVFGQIMNLFSKYLKKIKKTFDFKRLEITLLFGLGLVLQVFFPSYGLAASKTTCPVELKLKAEPSDWKRIFKDQKALNKTYIECSKERPIKEWHWTWKAGWIQQCPQLAKGLCKNLLMSTANDSAAMVRRLSYSRMGQVFELTRDQDLLGLLHNQFVAAGTNNKKIRETDRIRIIFAMKQIGGKKSLEQLSKASSLNQTQKDYIKSISRG